MGGEILKTVITRDIDEMYVLAAIIVLRAILTFVIHWEIKFDKDQQRVAFKKRSEETSEL